MKKINILKIKPMFTKVVVTMDKYEAPLFTDGGLIVKGKLDGDLKEYQKVVAIGNMVHEIKEGDLVKLNLIRYARTEHQDNSLKNGIITDNPIISYDIESIKMDGIEYLIIDDRDIEFIIEDYEEYDDNPAIKLN